MNKIFAVDLVQPEHWGFWTSGNDVSEESVWRWASGAKIRTDDPRWSGSNPDNHHDNEDCLIMRVAEQGKWHDWNCNEGWFGFICEIDALR